LLPDFAYACGSPLNEIDQYAIKSTPLTPPAEDVPGFQP
jgi:hypothetical protein